MLPSSPVHACRFTPNVCRVGLRDYFAIMLANKTRTHNFIFVAREIVVPLRHEHTTTNTVALFVGVCLLCLRPGMLLAKQ
jgi:hypothetical protein